MQLMIPGDIIAAVGLTMDAIGIVVLFFVAPEKYPDPQSLAFFAIEDDSRDRWKKMQSRRKIVSRISVVVIVVGFLLQGVAVVFF